MNKIYFTFLIVLLITACKSSIEDAKESNSLAKYEPEEGKCLLFVGQEMEAIGGLEKYNDGYLDHFKTPAGFTMYVKIRPGDEEFGFTYTGLDGIFSSDDWGDSPSHLALQIADPDYKNMALAIGLEMVNHEKAIASGDRDTFVDMLGEWIQSLGDRPVFLRIGYEFSGSWNHYDREAYIAAYQRIKDRYDEQGIDNVAYVWQSHGSDEPLELLESWYPGDAYVDWCGYSFFSRFDEANMIEFARSKNKPVFIAEATPTISTETTRINGKTKNTDLNIKSQADEAWEKWFIPFFNTIEENQDVVKAISYINCFWKSHPMWVDNPTFQGVDARLHVNQEIADKWKSKINNKRYIHSSPTLYKDLSK